MKCTNCGAEIDSSSKFCPECGQKIEIPVEQPIIENVDRKWYYVLDNASIGPVSDDELNACIQSGKINANTFVWKEGMENWIPLKEAGVTAAQIVAPNLAQHVKQWYYIGANNAQMGPYSESDMRKMVKNGTITPQTYVWCEGLTDWVFLSSSALKDAIVSQSTYSNQAKQTYTSSSTLVQRNAVVCILLSIVTCGIYGIYWLYCMIKDTNEICARHGDTNATNPGVVILLTIVTCGIYLIYWMYQAGKRLSTVTCSDGFRVQDESVILLVLTLFGLSIISYLILQGSINDLISHNA